MEGSSPCVPKDSVYSDKVFGCRWLLALSADSGHLQPWAEAGEEEQCIESSGPCVDTFGKICLQGPLLVCRPGQGGSSL